MVILISRLFILTQWSQFQNAKYCSKHIIRKQQNLTFDLQLCSHNLPHNCKVTAQGDKKWLTKNCVSVNSTTTFTSSNQEVLKSNKTAKHISIYSQETCKTCAIVRITEWHVSQQSKSYLTKAGGHYNFLASYDNMHAYKDTDYSYFSS